MTLNTRGFLWSKLPCIAGQSVNSSKKFPRPKSVTMNISHECQREELFQNLQHFLIFLTQKRKAAVLDFTGPAIVRAAALLAAWTDGWPQQSAEGSIRAGYLRIFPSGNWMIRPIRRLVTASARLILGEQKPQLNPVRDSVGLAVQSAAPFSSARTNRSTKER